MRFVATLLLWLVTTVALAVAVPTAVGADTTSSTRTATPLFAASAAKDPQLQQRDGRPS